jgi:hypothetical protein
LFGFVYKTSVLNKCLPNTKKKKNILIHVRHKA